MVIVILCSFLQISLHLSVCFHGSIPVSYFMTYFYAPISTIVSGVL